MRLNLGCGRSPMSGWTNLDRVEGLGVDVVADLESGSLPFPDNSIEEFRASHVIEHINNSLVFMQELHRVARDGSLATFSCPYGSSDDADADPTHIKRYFWDSWGYFSQPYYWRADYGYRGDWDLTDLVLYVSKEYAGKPWSTIFNHVQKERNVVREMVVTLKAIKPIREPLKSLRKQTIIRFICD